jgi:uncharacterized LabA/DUF88 family protein
VTDQAPGSIEKKIALLIDGDNAQPSLLDKILAEAGKYGGITIRRIYGDWTTANMNSWKPTLNNHAIQPVQQFRYTIGKNATDSALIIDAMDILHRGLVDGFCVVSSDSDYTRLATRIREAGIFVMGIGQKKTPKAFVNACKVFIYTENLTQTEAPLPRERERTERTDKTAPVKDTHLEETMPSDPLPLLKQAFDMAVGEDGWAQLGTIGNFLLQLDPGFDPRSYGFRSLSQLIKAYSKLFEIRYLDETGPTALYVKRKQR